MERIVLSDRNIPPKTAAEQLLNAAGLFDLVCTDGFYGPHAGFIACLHMLRSYYLWLAGERNAAFDALGIALENANALDQLAERSPESYTAPLLKNVKLCAAKADHRFAPELPELWPWWDVPERDRVKSEMQADPRWDAWAGKTR